MSRVDNGRKGVRGWRGVGGRGVNQDEIGLLSDLNRADFGGLPERLRARACGHPQRVARAKRSGRMPYRLKAGCEALEKRLAETRPDLLPKAQEYDQVLRRRLEGAET